MSSLVDQVLAERRAAPWQPRFRLALVTALVLHTAGLGLLFVPWATTPPPPREFVPVRLLPLQALGARDPAPRVSPPVPKPEPPKPEPPKAEPPPREVPPDPVPPVKPPRTLPSDKPKPTPNRTEPAPATASSPPAPAAAEREGTATGSAAGVAAFGSTLLQQIDPDFTYDYYLDRMLAAISRQWQRPPTDGQVEVAVRFVVQKSGEITDLEVVETSGFNAFDLAALRAVQNASPLPRLPVSYRKGSLSVTLIVR
jgi:TonB family protein